MKFRNYVRQKIDSRKGNASVFAAISIFMSVTLVFSGVQLYKINTVSASIQETCDASALASQNAVANFKEVVKACDAAIYTLNLTQAFMYGVSVVAAATGQAGISFSVFETATKVGNVRKKASQTAKKALKEYKKALPAISAAKAAIAASNNNTASNQFSGSAILIPATDDDYVPTYEEIDNSADDIESYMPELQDYGKLLAESEERLNAIKEQGFVLDCGGVKSLRERASSLASLNASQNPNFASSDVWDFNAPLERAFMYYTNRAKQERPIEQGNVREQARSYLRVDFYNYCASEIRSSISKGKDKQGLYSWPDIYSEKDGFKSSKRYSENIYPITEKDGKRYMHSNANLPCANGAVSRGSAKLWDIGDFETCETCEFTSNNVGNVPSATTNINTGFEYYYHKIEDLCKQYRDEYKYCKNRQDNVKELGGYMFKLISNILESAKNDRIKISAPGEAGSIAIVIDTSTQLDNIAGSAFVGQKSALGTRMAVSGARLLKDESDSLVAPVLDAITGGDDNAQNFEKKAFSSMAKAAVGDGAQAREMKDIASSGVDSGRLLASTVGKWVTDAFAALFDGMGLAPADMSVEKPILVNSYEVASGDDSFSKTYRDVVSSIRTASSSTSDGITGFIDKCEVSVKDKLKSSKLTLIKESLPVIGEIKIEIDLGELFSYEIDSMLSNFASSAKDIYQNTTGIRTWQ